MALVFAWYVLGPHRIAIQELLKRLRMSLIPPLHFLESFNLLTILSQGIYFSWFTGWAVGVYHFLHPHHALTLRSTGKFIRCR